MRRWWRRHFDPLGLRRDPIIHRTRKRRGLRIGSAEGPRFYGYAVPNPSPSAATEASSPTEGD